MYMKELFVCLFVVVVVFFVFAHHRSGVERCFTTKAISKFKTATRVSKRVLGEKGQGHVAAQ